MYCNLNKVKCVRRSFLRHSSSFLRWLVKVFLVFTWFFAVSELGGLASASVVMSYTSLHRLQVSNLNENYWCNWLFVKRTPPFISIYLLYPIPSSSVVSITKCESYVVVLSCSAISAILQYNTRHRGICLATFYLAVYEPRH
jgi:hypothetical protein